MFEAQLNPELRFNPLALVFTGSGLQQITVPLDFSGATHLHEVYISEVPGLQTPKAPTMLSRAPDVCQSSPPAAHPAAKVSPPSKRSVPEQVQDSCKVEYTVKAATAKYVKLLE